MNEGDPDSYKTIEAAFRAPELKVKGSRFIADIFPVTSKDEIDEYYSKPHEPLYTNADLRQRVNENVRLDCPEM